MVHTIPPHIQNQINNAQGLRKVLDYLCDGNQEAYKALYFIKGNYKEWDSIMKWLKDNKLTGQKLVEFFQNESEDGGGYHSGVTVILSRIKGHKHTLKAVKIDELN